MASLIISMGIGGSVGSILGILQDPIMNKVLSFSLKKLSGLARGEHLSEEDKVFIKDYNSRKYIHNGIDYTQQMKAMSFSPGMR